MYLREVIKLRGKPFPEPLPIQAEIIVEYLATNGIEFNKLDEETLILNDIYIPERLSQVEKLIADRGLNLEILRSVCINFEEEDYERNPLWILYFPEIWIDEVDFQKLCKVCNKKSIVLDLTKRVPRIISKKQVVTVNGQFTIVKKELKDKIDSNLSGAHFEPFDESGEYFHLLSKNSLGELVNSEEDFFGFNGICPECKTPVYDMFFGALKYKKSNWNGDDIVSGAFHEGVLFTEKAYKILKAAEKEVSREGVVILK
jgi:hypothetical protein